MTCLGDVLSLPQARLSDLGVDVPGITDPAEAYFKDGQWGWDGTQWRKLPLVFGYSAQYIEHEESLSVAAATHALDFSVVPAGEIWVVTSVAGWASTSNPSLISIGVVISAAFRRFLVRGYGTPWETYELPGTLVLAEGDNLRVRWSSCLLGDDIYADACGYKMAVAE